MSPRTLPLLTLLALPLPLFTMACCYGKAEPLERHLHSVEAVNEQCLTKCEVMDATDCPRFVLQECYAQCDYQTVRAYDRCSTPLWELHLCQSLSDYTCAPSGVVILKDYPDECLQQADNLIRCYEVP